MKVDVMIAGAQKAGTSSLKYYLQQHPDIGSHLNLECDFFTSGETDFDQYYARYFEAGRRTVLAKHAHLYKDEAFVAKLHAHNPECQIVFILREPVSRLISAYEMGKRDWIDFEPSSLLDALETSASGGYHVAYNVIIKLGEYDLAAEKLYKYFPRDQVRFISFKALTATPLLVCREIFRRLDVADDFLPDLQRKNVRYQNKSRLAARLITALKQSRVKGMVRDLMPYRRFLRLKEALEGLNQTEVSRQPRAGWDPAVLEALGKHYERSNERFEQLTGLRTSEFF